MVAFTIWIGSNDIPIEFIKNISTWKAVGGFSSIRIFRFDDEEIKAIRERYPFLDQWAKEKKFALVSDFLRYAIAVFIFPNTRVCYMDTDVSLIQPLNTLLMEKQLFACAKEDSNTYGSAVYLSNPSHYIPQKMMEFYVNDVKSTNSISKSFEYKDSLETISSPKILSNIIASEPNKERFNLIQDCTVLFPIYPWAEDGTEFTENTRAIHWVKGSWVNKSNIKTAESVKDIGRKLEQLITQ